MQAKEAAKTTGTGTGSSSNSGAGGSPNWLRVGNDAHQTFQDYLRQNFDPADLIIEQWSDPLGNWFGGRVDFANSFREEVSEIKPDNAAGLFSGTVKAEFYSMFSGYRAGGEWAFQGQQSIQLQGELGVYSYRYAGNGVVAYTQVTDYNKKFQSVLVARPSVVGPLPMPMMLPVP